MFKQFKEFFTIRKKNNQCLKRISFLFPGGYYIFYRNRICKLTIKNIKDIGFIKSLLSIYHISYFGIKEGRIIDAIVKTGTVKHAVISDSYCYLVFKKEKWYLSFKRQYEKNIEFFNYPITRPISFVDNLFYVIEPTADGRPLREEEIPQLLRIILKLFEDQQIVTEDENNILYYIQHDDPLPGNSLIDENGNIVFVDLDNITSRPALYDFFSVICRRSGGGDLLKIRETFKKELKICFNKHNIKYSESIYDLYLSKFVELRLSFIRKGFNNGILDKSVNWIFDPVVIDNFPLTKALSKTIKIESTPNGYKVI